jgi:hypothetical protein
VPEDVNSEAAIPVAPPAATVAQVWSPRRYVEEFAVPEAKRAVATVPEDMLEAFKLVSPDPAPVTVVKVAVLAVKLPEASRATIVFAPLAEAAVVAEFGMLVSEAPEPLNVVAVIVAAVKFPLASRATIVEAPLAEAAVVFAFGKVPVTLDCKLT